MSRIAMNMPRHIKPKPIHVLVAVRANSVRIVVTAFPPCVAIACAVACRGEEGGIGKSRGAVIRPASKPVRGERQPGAPDDGPDQARRADRGPQHQVASSAAPDEA